MKKVIVISCLFAIAFSAPAPPAPKKVYEIEAKLPSLLEIEASSADDAVRKARELFDIDIDIYNNNGAGYFGML